MKEEDLDKIVLAYLKKKGFRNAQAIFQQEAKVQPLELMSKEQELDLDSSLNNFIFLWNRADNRPGRYQENYVHLRNWVYNSLDVYKSELLRVPYPVFVHSFLQLVAKNYTQEARSFFNMFREEHEPVHHWDLQKLEGISNPQHLRENEVAQTFRENRVNVRLCQYSSELLMSFLHNSDLMQLLGIFNEHIVLHVHQGQPSAAPEEEEVVTITGRPQGDVDKLNKNEIRWGTLEDAVEHKFEEKQATEAAKEPAPQEGDSKDKEGAAKEEKAKEGGKVPGKRGRKPKGDAAAGAKKGETLTGPKGPRIESAIPLPAMSEDEELVIFEDLRKRVRLSSNALPSVCLYTFRFHHNGLNCVTMSADGALVAGGFSDSSIRVWDMSKGPTGEGSTQQGTEGGDMLMSEGARDEGAGPGPGSELGGGKSFDSGDYLALKGHAGPVYSAHFSPDAQTLLSCSADSTVRLWSMELGANLVAYKGHNYPVWDVQYSPLGHYFASASHDRTARVWSMERTQPLRVMAGHLSDVDCVRWHVNCNYIATGSSDKTVRLWDVQSGECMRIFTGHSRAVMSLAMSPCGRYLASGDEQGAIMLWDLGSGRRVSPLMGHTGCVWTLAFSGEGSLLASGSADCTVRLWDVSASNKAAKGDDKLTSNRRLRLAKTLPTKFTPVYDLRFSRRNLLFAAGAWSPPRTTAAAK